MISYMSCCQCNIVFSLGLLLGTKAPVITPNGVNFSFLFLFCLVVNEASHVHNNVKGLPTKEICTCGHGRTCP